MRLGTIVAKHCVNMRELAAAQRYPPLPQAPIHQNEADPYDLLTWVRHQYHRREGADHR